MTVTDSAAPAANTAVAGTPLDHPDYQIGLVDILSTLIHKAPLDEAIKLAYHEALNSEFFKNLETLPEGWRAPVAWTGQLIDAKDPQFAKLQAQYEELNQKYAALEAALQIIAGNKPAIGAAVAEPPPLPTNVNADPYTYREVGGKNYRWQPGMDAWEEVPAQS